MLNSRYIHLHEALGLGPMWLHAHAKVLPLSDPLPQPEQLPVSGSLKQAEPSVSVTAQTAESAFRQPEKVVMQSARLATLQRVGSSHLDKQAIAPSVAAVETETDKASNWLDKLSGSVARADVMVLSMCASPADIAAGRLYSGEDGVLLNKMLNAIGLRQEQILLATWLQDLPDFNPRPQPETVAAAAGRVAALWQLSQAKALLLLGNHFFAREDVMRHVYEFADNSAVFHIPHPQQILSDPKLKRGTWETLQQMQAALAA